jgi:hypothetical protein
MISYNTQDLFIIERNRVHLSIKTLIIKYNNLSQEMTTSNEKVFN